MVETRHNATRVSGCQIEAGSPILAGCLIPTSRYDANAISEISGLDSSHGTYCFDKVKHKVNVLRSVFEITHSAYGKSLIRQFDNVSIQAGAPTEDVSLIQAGRSRSLVLIEAGDLY